MEAYELLGPLPLRSIKGIKKLHMPYLKRLNIDGARTAPSVVCVSGELFCADGWTLVCLYGGGGEQASCPAQRQYKQQTQPPTSCYRVMVAAHVRIGGTDPSLEILGAPHAAVHC